MAAQGNALGHAAPKQVQALKGRHKIILTHKLRPMAHGSFGYALSGLDNKSQPQTQGVALGCHVPGFQPALSNTR